MTVSPPGGESYVEVQARMRNWYDQLTADTVAVAHGGTARGADGGARDRDARQCRRSDDRAGRGLLCSIRTGWRSIAETHFSLDASEPASYDTLTFNVDLNVNGNDRAFKMSFNTFGYMFRVTTFGESHGVAIGCVVDGCPPLLPLTVEDIQHDLDRRRPGQSRFTTQRQEPDAVKILSGVMPHPETGVQVTTRHADCAVDREHRSALEGLFRHQGQVPARPCRLHL